ncbi:hypothetical protein ACJJTC_014746 [Scirpophaga incertulas]
MDKKKAKSSRRSSSSSSSSSNSSDSSREKKKLRKLKKKLKKERKRTEKILKRRLKEEKRKKRRKTTSVSDRDDRSKDVIEETPADIPIALMERSKAMAPMTKEEWDKRQSIIRKVLDEESGRYRLLYPSLFKLLLDFFSCKMLIIKNRQRSFHKNQSGNVV